MKQEWVITKEPIYRFYIKVPQIHESDCYECGHTEKYIEWVRKGIGLTGYKTHKRKKTAMDYLMETTSKFYEQRLKDWADKESLFSPGMGKTIKFARYTGLDKEDKKL